MTEDREPPAGPTFDSGSRAPSETDLLAALVAAFLAGRWAIEMVYQFGPGWAIPLCIVLVAVVACVGLAWARRSPLAPPLALAAVLVAATVEQVWRPYQNQSDSLLVIADGIRVLLAGGNPYVTPLQAAMPAPVVYPYPPGSFLVYGPAVLLKLDVHLVEQVAALLLLGLFALLSRRIGAGKAALLCALYGTYGYGAFRTLDGSSDTTPAVLLAIAATLLAIAGRSSGPALWLSAAALALALSDKQTTWIPGLFLLRYAWSAVPAGRRYAAIVVGACALVAIPFLAWAPGPFLSRMVAAVGNERTGLYGLNLLGVVASANRDLATQLAPYTTYLGLGVLVVALVVLLRRAAPDVGQALLRGVGVVFVALYLARWDSVVYYLFLANLLLVVIALSLIAPRGRPTAAGVGERLRR